MARLIVLAGLPGSGKSTMARALSKRIGAIWLRVDSLNEAILAGGTVPPELKVWTYGGAQAIARDNLQLGLDVIADCVNEWNAMRDSWLEAGREAGAEVSFLEVRCSNADEHRARLERRRTSHPDVFTPDWDEVENRAWDDWSIVRATIDTAGRDVEECAAQVLEILGLHDGQQSS